MGSSRFKSWLLASRLATCILTCGLLFASALPAFAQNGRPEVSVGDHAVSPPVRDLPTNTELPGRRIKPLRVIPPEAHPAQPDGALQTSVTSAVATTPGLNFAGVGNGDLGFTPNAAPPDTNGAVGATTSDATGTFNLYAFTEPNFNDYPKLGVWPDAYYVTFNIFTNVFQGARACAFNRSAMLAGAAATQVCFQLSPSFASLLPSDLDGASGAVGTTSAPPAGTPNFLLNFGTNSLNLWTFHVDFVTPANSTLTGPTSIPVAAFTAACGGGSCVQQPNTRQKLDSLGDRLMYRLAYRNFAGNHESLVVNHSVQVGTTKRNPFTGVRWYELRRTPTGSGTFSVFQQGTFSPDSTFRWMGSAAMDKVGDIAVGYSASSSSVFPSIRYSGRVPTDAPGTLEAENSLQVGAGSQLPNLNRWGDYSAMSVDPGDDCTFFYTNEYLKASGDFNWSTRIGSFKFPGCQ